jgi:hypothetical protein
MRYLPYSKGWLGLVERFCEWRDPSGEIWGRFAIARFRWHESRFSPRVWPAYFRFSEEHDSRTKGWCLTIWLFPLFCFAWRYSFPAWDMCEVRSELWFSLFPGVPLAGQSVRLTYSKEWGKPVSPLDFCGATRVPDEAWALAGKAHRATH